MMGVTCTDLFGVVGDVHVSLGKSEVNRRGDCSDEFSGSHMDFAIADGIGFLLFGQ